MTAWLFTITVHLCVVTLCLTHLEPVGPNSIELLFQKGKGKSSNTKLKQEMLYLQSFYQDFVSTLAVVSFAFHTFTKKILFF